MTTTVKINGGKELAQFLEAFPRRVQKGALRSGATAAAKVFRTEARLRVPKQTGKLAKAIRSGSTRVDRDGTVRTRVYVDPRKPHGWLGYMVEFGTSPHFINAGDSGKSARMLTRQANRDTMREDGGVLIIGNNFVSGAVFHPGTPARPFMRPAFDAAATQAIKAFGDRVQSYLKGKSGFTGPTLEVDEAA